MYKYFILFKLIFNLFLGALCKNDANCTHWTWIDNTNSQLSWGYNWCFLKSSGSGEQNLAGVVSGIKNCHFQDAQIFEVQPICK